MIQGLSAGYGIHINNGYHGSPWVDQNRFDAGRLRMIGPNIEVYTGSSWVPITSGTAHVELDAEIVEILNWAQRKMVEEERLEKLASQVPAIADLKSKLEMMIALTKDYHEA